MIDNLDSDALMAGPLGHWLAGQDAERQAAAHTSNMRFLGLAAIALPAGLLLFSTIGFGVIAMLFFFVVMFAAIWAYRPRAEAIQRVKVGINQAIAEAVGISYAADGDPTILYQRAVSHKMLPSHNKRKFEDFWQGDVGGHGFHLFEAHLEYESTNSKGQRSTTTKFRGPLLAIGFARAFHGTTLVQRAGSHKRFGFFGGRKDSISIAGKELDAVDMVHPEFEDAFDIYSDDQVEARYLVHPAWVERMLDVERAFSGKKLRALFCEGELAVVVEAKNMFESGSMDASKDRERLEQTIGQFRALADLATTLNETIR